MRQIALNYRAKINSLYNRIQLLEKEKQKILQEIVELEDIKSNKINNNDLKKKYGASWSHIAEAIKNKKEK